MWSNSGGVREVRSNSFGSACELEYQFLLAKDLHLITVETYETANASMVDVKRMLQALLRRVQRDLRGAQDSSPSRLDKVRN